MLSLATVFLIHVTCVALTFTSFSMRAWLKWHTDTDIFTPKARLLPDTIDTVLLLSGVSLVVMEERSMLQEPWLMAKFFLLLVYVVCGSLALKRGKTPQIRLAALMGAYACFGGIVLLAFGKWG